MNVQQEYVRKRGHDKYARELIFTNGFARELNDYARLLQEEEARQILEMEALYEENLTDNHRLI